RRPAPQTLGHQLACPPSPRDLTGPHQSREPSRVRASEHLRRRARDADRNSPEGQRACRGISIRRRVAGTEGVWPVLVATGGRVPDGTNADSPGRRDEPERVRRSAREAVGTGTRVVAGRGSTQYLANSERDLREDRASGGSGAADADAG